jgi:hypothetical protein
MCNQFPDGGQRGSSEREDGKSLRQIAERAKRRLRSSVFRILAGTAWAATPPSPVDGGLTLAGKRIFGDNKTWRGFVVMVPAVGVTFMLLRILGSITFPGGWPDGLWPLSAEEYAGLGLLDWLRFHDRGAAKFVLQASTGHRSGREACVSPGEDDLLHCGPI